MQLEAIALVTLTVITELGLFEIKNNNNGSQLVSWISKFREDKVLEDSKAFWDGGGIVCVE